MIKRILKKGLKLPILLFRRQKAKIQLSELKLHESVKVKAVGDTLYEVLFKIKDSEEQEACTLIERRRSFLLNSHKEVSVIDYGAGKPNSHRTKEEMKKGVLAKALVGDICKASKSEFWATILFKLIRKLQPLSCIELGSCVGISAAYQGFALNINGRGNLTTLEGSPEIANIAKETLGALNLNNTSVLVGPFHETLKIVLESSKPVDFFFNDGHHDHDAVIENFNTAMPYLSDEAIVVIDDISWSPGMRKAWNEIEDDKRVVASIDLGAVGIVLIGDGSARKDKFRMPL
ncbi:o-methyltransferase [Leptolyngbya sp. Heron Island J]|uniref:O-methyltransferase n=1 Tax=Leptolyngbya sp. Heron Island J TaxID=1385935 RepID=UPI0003B9AB32|nr:class I SAM-dependent methyltransferase [Leptolyngbya sp. Heron Island J]ESA33576.1 o-methyltransferase [Leptolyngbya sp. Heron Island J]